MPDSRDARTTDAFARLPHHLRVPWERKTSWHLFTEGVQLYRIQATWGMEYLKGNPFPYFHITAEVERKDGRGRWVEDSGGCLHDEVRKHFPELGVFIPWHLCDPSGPMHYAANGLYWWEYVNGKRPKDRFCSTDPMESFKHTVVFGALESDRIPTILDTCDEVEVWLEARLPSLCKKFDEEVLKAEGLTGNLYP